MIKQFIKRFITGRSGAAYLPVATPMDMVLIREGGNGNDMKPRNRKIIALLALLATAVMLWLEREPLARGTGESWFWLVVAGLVVVLAAAEFAGVGSGDAPK